MHTILYRYLAFYIISAVSFSVLFDMIPVLVCAAILYQLTWLSHDEYWSIMMQAFESRYVKCYVITSICSFQSHGNCKKNMEIYVYFLHFDFLQFKNQFIFLHGVLYCYSRCGLVMVRARRDLFYKHGLTYPSRMSNYIHHEVWDEITYPFSKFNSAIKWKK